VGEKMETYLEGIASKVDWFLPLLQGTSPLDWAVYKGIESHVPLCWHRGRPGNEEDRRPEQPAHGCKQGENLEHDEKSRLVNGEVCEKLMVGIIEDLGESWWSFIPQGTCSNPVLTF
jgi:hypothetical protein